MSSPESTCAAPIEAYLNNALDPNCALLGACAARRCMWAEEPAFAQRLVDEVKEDRRIEIAEVEEKAGTDLMTNLLTYKSPIGGKQAVTFVAEAIWQCAQGQTSEERSLHDLRRPPNAVAVTYCDSVAFKSINDTFGHDMGDLMLSFLASCLRAGAAGDKIMRMGGDEFIIIQKAYVDDMTYRGADSFSEVQEELWASSTRRLHDTIDQEWSKHEAHADESMFGRLVTLVKPDGSGIRPRLSVGLSFAMIDDIPPEQAEGMALPLLAKIIGEADEHMYAKKPGTKSR